MKEQSYRIAGGNTTMLVENCPEGERERFAQYILENYIAEQVGFEEEKDGLPYLKMMGGELSVNGMIAFAYKQNKREGEILASGVKEPVTFDTTGSDGLTRITFNLPYKEEDDLVLFDEGIGYLVTQDKMHFLDERLERLAKTYKLPAFGLARYTQNEVPELEPLVYVDKIKSCILETACGSGSIAIKIKTGASRIKQPTGEIIEVYRNNGGFTVGAEVVKIRDRKL